MILIVVIMIISRPICRECSLLCWSHGAAHADVDSGRLRAQRHSIFTVASILSQGSVFQIIFNCLK